MNATTIRATILAAIRAKTACTNKFLAAEAERTIEIALRHLAASRMRDAKEQADMAMGMLAAASAPVSPPEM